MTTLELGGLDGLNPLGFLAALGTLRVAEEHACAGGHPRPRMSWVENGTWRPLIQCSVDLEGLIDAVLTERVQWTVEPAFSFAYSREGARLPASHKAAIRDLKPSPEVASTFFQEVADDAAAGRYRSARQAAAYASDVVTDNNGNIKPTALHFTAGQQTFLGAVAEIHGQLTEDHVREALLGPWSRSSALKSLGWDPLGAFSARMYALRSSDPSKEKRPCVPGAEWLAFLGLAFFPTAPVRGRLMTTGVHGGWKDAVLRWPLWGVAAGSRSVESLLRAPEVWGTSDTWRAARGVELICAAPILRADQGGYGSFGPTSIV